MKINVESTGNVSILQCGGNLDADSVGSFKQVTNGLVDEGSINLVVDCADLDFVDSMGLGALISLLRRVRQREGDLKVAALSEDVKTIFEITRLHRLFEVCETTELACKKFTKANE
tara:strand:+ start:170 stop:517 length:348 start_codon:yes stop_codon:yes gene_type:complete